jgi:hypothetical protein
VSTGPWHEHTNTQLRDLLRAKAGEGWHLLADSDEFHAFPVPLPELIAEAENATGTVGGLMLDRSPPTAPCPGWSPQDGGLDGAYPLGGFFTHHLLRGDPRKIVLAHSTVPVASGNHRAEGHRPVNRPPVVVHHFKWRSGVRENVEQRAVHWADGTWQDASPAGSPRSAGSSTTWTSRVGGSTCRTSSSGSGRCPRMRCQPGGRMTRRRSSRPGGRLPIPGGRTSPLR